MKFNRFAGLALAGLCTLCATDALANDTVAVMKLDALGDNVESQTTMVLEALREQVMNSDLTLDANGSDITYTEMQMVTGCENGESIACYDMACETLGAPAIIFGSVKDGGETHIVWYVSGKGIFREKKGVVTDKASAEKLAQSIIVGEMGSLVVTSNIPGADVFIDGKRVGMSAEFEENATPIQLVAGNYIVAVRKDGYEKEDAVKVTIEGNNVAKLHVDMAVAQDPEAIAKAVRIAGYSSLGVGVASLIAGGVLVGLTCTSNGCGTGSWWETNKIKNHLDDFKAGKIKDDLNDDGSVKTKANVIAGGRMEKGNSSGSQASLSGQILLGVGGLFTAAGIALTVVGFVHDFAGEDVEANNAMPKIDFNVTPEYQGMTMGWRF